MWKLEKVMKLGKLLELYLIREDKVPNEYHLPLRTNHDHLIRVIGILAPKEDTINKITLIAEKV